MFPRLLVPLDGSSVAAQAIPYAITLAHAFRSHVTLLSVVEPDLDRSGLSRVAGREADERARALALVYLGTVADRLHGEDLVVSAEVRRGNPAATLLAAAEEGDHSLIVMATHGRSGINRLRLGSVAQHTVRHAPIPTLVVRAEERTPSEDAAAIPAITVTLDGSALAEQALPAATMLADALHVPLTLLEILPNYYYSSYAWPGMVYPPSPEQQQAEEEAITSDLEATAQRLRAPGREVRMVLRRSVTNRADPVIINHLADQPAGVAVMASHGRGGIARWVLGSTAEAVIAQPPCAVLVVRARIEGERERVSVGEYSTVAATA